MGNLSWACLGVCATTVCGLASAQSVAPAGPAHVAPGASAAFPPASAAPLPPPPPPPPAAPVSSASPAATPLAPAAAAPPPPTSPAPYPAGPYPPAPYGYPPPLPYGYYYPPLALLPPKPRFPEDAAVLTSPFIDAIVGGASWQDRISQPLNFGVQAGAYLGRRVRLVARAAFPSSGVDDQSGFDSSLEALDYERRPSNAPIVLYGASAGIVVYGTQYFALAPGVAFARTDVSDYGTMLAASVPFDWVMASGLRVGFEAELGEAFGGSLRYQCIDSTGVMCGGPANTTRDRATGTAIFMQFQLGFGFNHPDPLAAPSASQQP
jgi:hypothetical protein